MPYYKAPDNSLHFLSNIDIANGGEAMLPAGSVSITDEEAEALLPKPQPVKVTSVTMRQARLALYDAGLLDTVDESLALMPIEEQRRKAQIEWEFSTEVKRDSALVFGLAGALALTDDALDALFEKASKL